MSWFIAGVDSRHAMSLAVARMKPNPAFRPVSGGSAAKKPRTTCLGCLGLLLLISFCGGVLNTGVRENRGSWGPSQDRAAPSDSGSANYAQRIRVSGATVFWRPSFANPSGPKLVWVKPHIQNLSDVPIGVVWAYITARTLDGNVIVDRVDEIIFLAEGTRAKLSPGATYSGDGNDEGDPYPPFDSRGELISEQPVKVDVEVFGAYENPDTGSRGQILDFE